MNNVIKKIELSLEKDKRNETVVKVFIDKGKIIKDYYFRGVDADSLFSLVEDLIRIKNNEIKNRRYYNGKRNNKSN